MTSEQFLKEHTFDGEISSENAKQYAIMVACEHFAEIIEAGNNTEKSYRLCAEKLMKLESQLKK